MIHVTQEQIEAMTLADRIALIPVISYSASMVSRSHDGQKVRIGFDPAGASLFDSETELRL